jgi:type II secretion system protein H
MWAIGILNNSWRRFSRSNSDPNFNLKSAAFTLLELLVVMAIMAVMTGLAVSGINFRTQESPALKQAQRIHALFALAQEESILWDLPMIVQLNDTGYQFLQQRSGEFIPSTTAQFRARSWSDEVKFKWLSGGEQASTDEQFVVIFYPTGQTSPYEFRLWTQPDDSHTLILSSEGAGEFKLEAQ